VARPSSSASNASTRASDQSFMSGIGRSRPSGRLRPAPVTSTIRGPRMSFSLLRWRFAMSTSSRMVHARDGVGRTRARRGAYLGDSQVLPTVRKTATSEDGSCLRARFARPRQVDVPLPRQVDVPLRRQRRGGELLLVTRNAGLRYAPPTL